MFLEQFTHNGKEGDRPIVPRVGRVTRFGYWDNEGRLPAVRTGSYLLKVTC